VDVTLISPVLKGYERCAIIMDSNEFFISAHKSDGPGHWRMLNLSSNAVQGLKLIHHKVVKCYTDFGFVFIRLAA
jgi:hypothetical protein